MIGSIFILNEKYRLVVISRSRAGWDRTIFASIILLDDADIDERLDIRLPAGIVSPKECAIACGGIREFLRENLRQLKRDGRILKKYLPFFKRRMQSETFERLFLMHQIKNNTAEGVYNCK